MKTENSLGIVYEAPSAAIVNLLHKRVICVSDGTTEKYNTQSVWDLEDEL